MHLVTLIATGAGADAALLFDGFDELQLRVGYDNADDYLRTPLASVAEQAKVVLTSRTAHFPVHRAGADRAGRRLLP